MQEADRVFIVSLGTLIPECGDSSEKKIPLEKIKTRCQNLFSITPDQRVIDELMVRGAIISDGCQYRLTTWGWTNYNVLAENVVDYLENKLTVYEELRAEEGSGQMVRGGQVVGLPHGNEIAEIRAVLKIL